MKTLLIKTIIPLCGAFVVGCNSPCHRMCDSKAIAQTVALYENLYVLAEKGTMLAHQDDCMYGYEWAYETGRSDIKECCGDYPAIFGFDLGHIESGAEKNLDGVPFDRMREEIIAAFERGAIVTLSWHALNPVTGESAWSWPREENSTVKRILDDESCNAEFNRSLDRAAEFIASLRTADGTLVPILLRLWHENTCGAFWWGSTACSPEEYKRLWVYSVEYLRDKHDLHNLIYVYSSDRFDGEEQYLERYAGDEWVDVLGADIYCRPTDFDYVDACDHMLSTLKVIGNRLGKPVAMTETGYEGIDDAKWFTTSLLSAIADKGLSWVLLWRNANGMEKHFFAPWHGHESEADFVEFVNNSACKILTENDLENVYVLK